MVQYTERENKNDNRGGNKMKALGIVRRIDDLGRVVIPKEVRKSQGWDSGEPMEMFLSEEGLVIRPYGLDGDKQDLVRQLAALKQNTENLDAINIYDNAIRIIKGL